MARMAVALGPALSVRVYYTPSSRTFAGMQTRAVTWFYRTQETHTHTWIDNNLLNYICIYDDLI